MQVRLVTLVWILTIQTHVHTETSPHCCRDSHMRNSLLDSSAGYTGVVCILTVKTYQVCHLVLQVLHAGLEPQQSASEQSSTLVQHGRYRTNTRISPWLGVEVNDITTHTCTTYISISVDVISTYTEESTCPNAGIEGSLRRATHLYWCGVNHYVNRYTH